MPQWSYTGRSAGTAVSGQLEAVSAGAVAEQLLARGVTPLHIVASAVPQAGVDLFASWRKGKVTATEKLLFARQLHTLLRSGVPILSALTGLQESSDGALMRQTLQQVRRSLESGQELSLALAQHPKVFDTFYVSMVRVGEMTGRLDEVFKRLFEHMEFEIFMRQQVKSALRYPSFVIIAMVAAIAVINLMVVPAFATVFSSFGADLPWATKLLIGSSRLTLEYGWALALGAVAGFFALRRWIATPAGRLAWDRLGLRLRISATPGKEREPVWLQLRHQPRAQAACRWSARWPWSRRPPTTSSSPVASSSCANRWSAATPSCAAPPRPASSRRWCCR